MVHFTYYHSSLQNCVVRWRVLLSIYSFYALPPTNVELGIFLIHPLTPNTLLGLVQGFKFWVAQVRIDRVWYHIIVWPNSSLQNRIVRWGVSFYITEIDAWISSLTLLNISTLTCLIITRIIFLLTLLVEKRSS